MSNEAVTTHYEKARFAILTGIVRTTPDGYRANDARFLIGAIYWRQRRTADALRWWRELTVSRDDSADSEILAALRSAHMDRAEAGTHVDEPLRRAIDHVLKNENGRWLSFSYDRLRHFGYRLDTY